MKKKKLQIVLLISIIILLVLGISKIKFNQQDETIDLTGSNSFWKVSLNVHKGYDSVLILQPRRGKFEIPKSIKFDLKVSNKSIYNGSIVYTKDPNPDFLGKYKLTFKDDIAKQLEKNKDIKIDISFNNQVNTVKFQKIEIYKN